MSMFMLAVSYIQEAAKAVQQLDNVSRWCHDTGSLINPNKAQTLWCTLDNSAPGKAMPAVTLIWWSCSQTSELSEIPCDRLRQYSDLLKCKESLPVSKVVVANGIEKHHLFLLYESVAVSGIDYGQGIIQMAQTILLKLDRVQNEAIRVMLGTTKDTPTETIRFMTDLPPMQTRQKMEQVKTLYQCCSKFLQSTRLDSTLSW